MYIIILEYFNMANEFDADNCICLEYSMIFCVYKYAILRRRLYGVSEMSLLSEEFGLSFCDVD